MTPIRHFLLKPWLYIAIVLAGTLLKFYELKTKLFWVDETSTIIYTSGLKSDAIQRNIPVNQIEGYGYYDSILHLKTNSLSLKNEVTGILADTHLTPAHYVFLTFWYRLAGDNDMDYRLFSVFIFILSLPFVFLLAKNLFNSSLGGWIALSLYSVSPIIHFEAQEARYYILWVFFFILSNCLFLQAIKYNRLVWWIAYSAAAILALYTSLSSAPFILGHLLYVILFKKQLRMPYFISLLFIGLAYLPWIHFLYTVRGSIQNGLSWQVRSGSPFFSLDLLFFQLLGFARSFAYLFDVKLYWAWNHGTAIPGIYPALLTDIGLLAFILYAIYYLFAKTSREARWLAILIVLPLFMVLYVSDIFRNGFTSLLWRYQIVNMVAVSLIVSNLLKDKIAQGKWVFAGIYLGLISLGFASIWTVTSDRCWNTSPDCEYRIEEAQLFSQAANPLIITDFSGLGSFERALSVLNSSKAKKADILYCKGAIPDIRAKITGKAYSEIFVFASADTIVRQMRSQFGNSLLPCRKVTSWMSPQIWQIKLPPQ